MEGLRAPPLLALALALLRPQLLILAVFSSNELLSVKEAVIRARGLCGAGSPAVQWWPKESGKALWIR